jgi:hypothetical protein
VSDVEQSFMLKEMIRYLQDESSGVVSQFKLGKDWKEVCTAVHQKVRLTKSSNELAGAVSNWFQTLRYLSIQLSVAVGKPCSVRLSKKHKDDGQQRLNESIANILESPVLRGDFEVPNAANNLVLELDLSRKSLQCSIEIKCPKDVKQARAAINFVVNQLKCYDGDDLEVTVNYPGRIKDLSANIRAALDEDGRKLLLHDHTKELPVSVIIWRDYDLGTQALKSPSLPQTMDQLLQGFYDDVVEELRAWQPKAPRIRRSQKPDNDETTLQKAVGSNVEPDTATSISGLTFLKALKR